MEYTNLFELITNEHAEIDAYLEDVNLEQFKNDVRRTVQANTPKESIITAIKGLQSLLDTEAENQ